VAFAACGSDSGGSSSSGTHLDIEGVATSGIGSVATEPDSPPREPVPVPEPGPATEVDISGSLRCDGPKSTGTGMFAATAVEVCLRVEGERAVFEQVGTADDEACAEVYGGPQHATIEGVIAGVPVDVTVARTNSCGIQDWERLEFLLGPPER
jgi:hypothetical protein